MRVLQLISAYFSPETVVPATSIVATIVGILLMVGRGSLRFLFRSTQRNLVRRGQIAGTSKPHLHRHEKVRSRTTRF